MTGNICNNVTSDKNKHQLLEKKMKRQNNLYCHRML